MEPHSADPRESLSRAGEGVVLSWFIFQLGFFNCSVEDGLERTIWEVVAHMQMRALKGLDPELGQWLWDGEGVYHRKTPKVAGCILQQTEKRG